MKKILIGLLGIALILGLAIPGLAEGTLGYGDFDYDATCDVKITVDIPTIKLLDMHNAEGDNNIVWPDITAADLDRGYSTVMKGTSFIVSSNEDWEVNPNVSGGAALSTTTGAGYFFFLADASTSDLTVAELNLRSWYNGYATGGGAPDNVGTTDWAPFATGGALSSGVDGDVSSICTGTAGGRMQFAIDYKLDIDWNDSISNSSQSYYVTITYTLGAAS